MTEAGSPSPLAGRRAAGLLVVLFLVSAFAQIDRILPFILAEAIKAELGLSDTLIGLLTGLAFAFCYVLLSLPMARLSDRGSPRIVLVGCMLVWSAMTALGGAATGFVTLAATRLGVAIGEAGAVPSSHAIIARRIGPERRGFAIGIFSMGIPVGTMLGFGLGGWIAETSGWRTALTAAGGAGILIGIATYFATGATPPIPRPVEAASFRRESAGLVADPPFRALLVLAVCIGFAAPPFYAFAAPFLIRAHDFSTAQAGLVFGLSQGVLGAVGTVLGGRRFDRVARTPGSSLFRAPMLAFVVAGLALAGALVVGQPWLALVLMMPAMFAFAFTLPFAFGAAHRIAGPGREAIASSLAMIASGLIGPTLGPLLVGAASDAAAGMGAANGLAYGLMLVPLACAATVAAFRRADRALDPD
ncbi:putative MFS family arabinose efflux permease [Sphingomonas yantingensis]|uniref:Putative MFS family arabinose efflux permease n=1 Tax=Sphingomonas yantingensis TaxID=1241761 RepID=A0A7W9EIH6_9SPHN|nr:putative MFS family arabinose efflux permease [Sphingomonas yantingensis]